jgi:hypothetical protein
MSPAATFFRAPPCRKGKTRNVANFRRARSASRRARASGPGATPASVLPGNPGAARAREPITGRRQRRSTAKSERYSKTAVQRRRGFVS